MKTHIDDCGLCKANNSITMTEYDQLLRIKRLIQTELPATTALHYHYLNFELNLHATEASKLFLKIIDNVSQASQK